MSKDKHFFGIDVSKDTLDIYDFKGNHYQFPNNLKGFKKLLKLMDLFSHVVMEATGYYHTRNYIRHS